MEGTIYEGCMRLNGNTSSTTTKINQNTTPSAGSSVKSDDKKAMNSNTAQCDVDKDGICLIHNCGTKKVPTSISKWYWLEKKKKYGYKTVKVTRYIRMSRISGRVDPINSPQSRRLAEVDNVSVDGIIRRLSTTIESKK